MTFNYRQDADRQWSDARRKAFMRQLRAYVTRNEQNLVDFDDLANRLKLRNQRYIGLQDVLLEHIVGSVARYDDFMTAFLPKNRDMEERWKGVAKVFIDPTGNPPPIECYKVGKLYFVRDGNHRVSVARQLEMASIEAYVWEYRLPGVDENSDIDSLLINVEQSDFLACTGLDELRPGHNIQVTNPGGYPDLLDSIVHYHERLRRIDAEEADEVTFEDAVTAWYDMIYEPSVDIIAREGALQHFPDRTPVDLFIWTHRHREELQAHARDKVRLTSAVQSLKTSTSPNQVQKLTRQVKKWLPGTADH